MLKGMCFLFIYLFIYLFFNEKYSVNLNAICCVSFVLSLYAIFNNSSIPPSPTPPGACRLHANVNKSDVILFHLYFKVF